VIGTDGCPDLQGKSTEAHLEYLRGDRSKLAPKCIVAAIRYIGAERYAKASAVLIQYLDYHEPDYRQQIPLRLSIPNVYPAVDALNSLGKPVVPELIAVVSNLDAPELVRRNAAEAIFLIYAVSPEGIAVLVRAAHAEKDPMASNLLMDQARRLAATCLAASRNDCENAALKRE